MRHKISVRSDRGIANKCKEHYPAIKNAALCALEYERVGIPCRADIRICGDAEIHRLNMQYRNVDRPTDVLSFPMQQFEDGFDTERLGEPCLGELFLGDIVISYDRAQSQAEEYGHSVSRELGFLTVHALLHLLGYDHECSKEREEAMFSRQEAILEKAGLKRL